MSLELEWMSIDDLKLPSNVIDIIKNRGIKKLNPPQTEAVKKRSIRWK